MWCRPQRAALLNLPLPSRIAVLEEHMRRVLLIVGAAGTMLSEVRRDEEDGR
jgi:hypothetical protein